VSDGYGLSIQEKAVRAWAKANGHRIVRLVSEEGVSGAKEAVDRPGLSEALTLIQDGTAEGLLIPRLDRLARSVTVQEATLAFVWRHGGRVYAADSGDIAEDQDDPYRIAMREMAGVFAGLERRIIVKRLKDGRAAKDASGRKSVGAYAYGTHGVGEGRERDAGSNPAEAAAHARILELRRSGKSYREICEALNAEGHRPRRAERWQPMVVRAICRRAGLD
jgi:DNA invertase Pin-like site-specific DNA recombinase